MVNDRSVMDEVGMWKGGKEAHVGRQLAEEASWVRGGMLMMAHHEVEGEGAS